MNSSFDQSDSFDTGDFSPDALCSHSKRADEPKFAFRPVPILMSHLEDEDQGAETAETEEDFEESHSRDNNRLRIICFECNRLENHSLAEQERWFFSYLLGLTFGLVLLIGPYRCQCCGGTRLMRTDYLNPRYWALSARRKGNVKTKQRR